MDGTGLIQHEDVVRPEWIDSNGHMNLAYYVVVFDRATDLLFAHLDIGNDYRHRTNNSNFVVETHTIYEREVTEGDRLRVQMQLLGADDKRLHVFHEMFQVGEGFRTAVQELLCLNIDMATRRVTAFPPDKQAELQAAVRVRGDIPLPSEAGRRIAMPAAARADRSRC